LDKEDNHSMPAKIVLRTAYNNLTLVQFPNHITINQFQDFEIIMDSSTYLTGSVLIPY